MNCKHCQEPIERNTSNVKIEPNQKAEYKHSPTHLIGCFTKDGNPTGRQAEPA